MKLDIIGDVHGCIDELHELFSVLGYTKQAQTYTHPEGRTPVFVGDITDRGPGSVQVIELVYELVTQKKGKYVPGNHCDKLYRYFLGNNVKVNHGLETTIAEYKALPAQQQKIVRKKFMTLFENAPLYLQIPELEVIIAHAGIKQSFIGRNDKKVKSFVLYGDATGEFYPDGRPIRRDWAQHYKGDWWIVYGHTPVKKPRMKHNTINIDTGCVFGNALTAFRLPEESCVSVPSKQPYMEDKFHYFN